MPYKRNGVLFELQPRPTKGDDGKPLLYAQPVITNKYTVDDIDEFCVKNRHTLKGEIKHLFGLLEEVTALLLKDGNRVDTPFGSLAPKLKLLGEHTDPEKVMGRDIMYGGVEFIPFKKFVEAADCSREGFRRKKDSVGNAQINDPKFMDEALLKSVRHGHVTISIFMIFSGLKYDSAKKYLDSLCTGENPRLRRYKESRTWYYAIVKTPTEP